jgi:hypothetical protein
MERRNERGEGRLSGFLWLVFFAGVAYAGWNVGPIFFDNWVLKDAVTNICRQPRNLTDEKVMDMLVKEVQERGMTDYIGRRNFRIQTFDTYRKVSLDYEREGQVLPGWRRIFRFDWTVEQPLIF